MGYIIENANIYKGNKLSKSSLLIRENNIVAQQTSFNRYKYIKMNTEAYIMTPTYVLLDSKIPLKASFQELKNYITNQFLLKGCTTVLIYATISYASELRTKIKEIKTALLSCPIDYVIGVKIPIRILSASFIRECKKEKVPAIFLEFNDADDFNQIPWGWIRDALFPYNSPLIPIFSNPAKKEAKSVMSKWKETMEKEKIPSISYELTENTPLEIPILNKVGIYPQKASLLNGSELSYNLYLKSTEINNVDEAGLFHYHGDRLVVTVHKGKVIRASNEVLYEPGFGEYVKVRTPSYFSF